MFLYRTCDVLTVTTHADRSVSTAEGAVSSRTVVGFGVQDRQTRVEESRIDRSQHVERKTVELRSRTNAGRVQPYVRIRDKGGVWCGSGVDCIDLAIVITDNLLGYRVKNQGGNGNDGTENGQDRSMSHQPDESEGADDAASARKVVLYNIMKWPALGEPSPLELANACGTISHLSGS